MRLSSLFNFSQRLQRSWLSKLDGYGWKNKTNSVSLEYERWRHEFILQRLHLMTWIAIIACLMNVIIDWTIFIPSLNTNSPLYAFMQKNTAMTSGAIAVLLLQFLFALVLFKVTFTRRYPLLIFLWIISALFLVPQSIWMVFGGYIRLAESDWMIFLAIIAILMPVRWRWHLLAQSSILIQFVVGYLLIGLRDPFVDSEVLYFKDIYSTVVVFIIINLGIFLYERLLRQEFELQRQLKLFLHTVSHDLRNPVLSNMFLLKSLHDTTTKEISISHEILKQMIDSSDRQLRLIDSLLEAHNTEIKGIAVRSRPVCLNSLVESVIREMQPLLARQEVTTTIKTSAKLPLANIDPLQIRRIYENLIANAIEYNRAGLHLTFKVEQGYCLPDGLQAESDYWIYCSVSDDGEGIPLQQHSQLFDLYTRASSGKQSLGVGLGLYICRQIVNAHGGKIGINDTPKGASFWFTLPIARTDSLTIDSSSTFNT